MASLSNLWNREFWRSLNEVPTRHASQEERTSIVALRCEVSSRLTRGLIEAVVCLPSVIVPTDDQVIVLYRQKTIDEPNSKHPLRRAGKQAPEPEPQRG